VQEKPLTSYVRVPNKKSCVQHQAIVYMVLRIMTREPSSPSLPLPHVRWERGGEALICAFDGKMITLNSTTSAAPGTPLVALASDGQGHSIEIIIKVRTCRKTSTVGFSIWGRVTNATRNLCEKLQTTLS